MSAEFVELVVSVAIVVVLPIAVVVLIGRQFFYCHLVILLPLGNSTATFHISTAMAVEIDFHFITMAVEVVFSFYCHGSRSRFQFLLPWL